MKSNLYKVVFLLTIFFAFAFIYHLHVQAAPVNMYYPLASTTYTTTTLIPVNFQMTEPLLTGSLHLKFIPTSYIGNTILITFSDTLSSNPFHYDINPRHIQLTDDISSVSGGMSIPEGIYTVELSWFTLGGIAGSESRTNVVIDWLEVDIYNPVNNSFYNVETQIQVSLKMNEPLLADSFKMHFIPTSYTGSTITLNISSSLPENPFEFGIDSRNPTIPDIITSATASSIPDGVYDIEFEWRSLANNLGNMRRENVHIDMTVEPIVVFSPITNGVYATETNILPIKFQLGETPLSLSTKILVTSVNTGMTGEIVLKNFTPGIVHEFNLDIPSATSLGNVMFKNFASMPHGYYNIAFEYKDVFNNIYRTPSIDNIRIGNLPNIVINSPQKDSNKTIKTTTIKVTSDDGINKDNVSVGNSSTVSYNNFVCTQTSFSEVNCTIDITSSGTLIIHAVSNNNLQQTEIVSGYTITSFVNTNNGVSNNFYPQPNTEISEDPKIPSLGETVIAVESQEVNPEKSQNHNTDQVIINNSNPYIIFCLIFIFLIFFAVFFFVINNKKNR